MGKILNHFHNDNTNIITNSKFQMSKQIAVITKEDLSLVSHNLLNENQLKLLMMPTPAEHIYERPAKGGGTWKYVTGTHTKKVLNLAFGWNWSHEVVEYKIDLEVGQAYVLGKLLIHGEKRDIVKMQFGRVDIKFKTEPVFDENGNPVMEEKFGKNKQKRQPSKEPLDVGNDLKAATTDSLKKCASELGFFSDVYAPDEYQNIQIVKTGETDDEKLSEITRLLALDGLTLDDEQKTHIERIINNQETNSYNKAIKLLNRHKPAKKQTND